METEVKTESRGFEGFNNQDFVLMDYLRVTGITTYNNLKLNKEALKEVTFGEWRSLFLVDEVEGVYVYRENQKIKYGKEVVEDGLINFIGFYKNAMMTWKRIEKELIYGYYRTDIKVLFNPQIPEPIVFVIESEGNNPCLVIAPRIET